MNDIKINSPAISNFYHAVASQIQQWIPREYNAVELAAASTSIAQRLAGAQDPQFNHFREAVQLYLKELPEDTDLAVGIVKMDAGKVLGVPGLASDHAKIHAARQALLDAQAELDMIQAREGQRLQRIHALDRVIFDAQNSIQKWTMDFDGIEAQAEATISEHFGDCSVGAAYNIHHINAAIQDLTNVPILRRLAPAAIAKLNAKITAARAELDTLRAAGSDTNPEPEPIKLTRGRQKLATDVDTDEPSLSLP